MKKINEIRRCKCPCNKELGDQYKGRRKDFFSPECRKVFHGITLTKKEEDRYYNR